MMSLLTIMTLPEIFDRIDQIRECKRIQGCKGNIDQGDYMVGLYNGLEMALAIMENRVAEYKDCGNRYHEVNAVPSKMV